MLAETSETPRLVQSIVANVNPFNHWSGLTSGSAAEKTSHTLLGGGQWKSEKLEARLPVVPVVVL